MVTGSNPVRHSRFYLEDKISMKILKKKIKFSKYQTLFFKNKLYFICLLDTHKNYNLIRKELIANNFQVKFIQNGFLKNIIDFAKVKNYLTGQLFCVFKNKLDFQDYKLINSLLFSKGYIILFYLDNRFYANDKLVFFNKFIKSKISKMHHLSYLYFLLKLGFVLKLEKLSQVSR